MGEHAKGTVGLIDAHNQENRLHSSVQAVADRAQRTHSKHESAVPLFLSAAIIFPFYP